MQTVKLHNFYKSNAIEIFFYYIRNPFLFWKIHITHLYTIDLQCNSNNSWISWGYHTIHNRLYIFFQNLYLTYDSNLLKYSMIAICNWAYNVTGTLHYSHIYITKKKLWKLTALRLNFRTIKKICEPCQTVRNNLFDRFPINCIDYSEQSFHFRYGFYGNCQSKCTQKVHQLMDTTRFDLNSLKRLAFYSVLTLKH